MAKIDDFGNLDYTDPTFQAPSPTNKAPADFQGPGGLDGNGNPATTGGDKPPQPSTPPPDGFQYVWDGNQWNWAPIGNVASDPGAAGGDPLSNPNQPPSAAAAGFNWQFTNGQWVYSPNASSSPSAPAPSTGGGSRAGGGGNPAPSPSTPNPAAPPTTGNQTNPALLALIGQLLSGQSSSNNNPLRASLSSSIQGLLSKYSADPTANDPSLAPQIDAYGSQVDRSMQQFREQAAERAHAEGVPSGAFDSQIGGALTSAGGAKASYAADTVGKELQNRRQALQSVLTSGAGLLGEQDTNDANTRIASIDATLKAMGLDVTAQGNANTFALGKTGLDNQLTLGQGQLSLGNKNSDQQNSQFYDNLTNTMGTNNSLINEILLSLKLGGSNPTA